MRSYRAGTGQLGSLACLSGGAGPVPKRESPGPGAAIGSAESVFSIPTKATAFVLASLMALGIICAFHLRWDMAEMDRVAQLARLEHKIADHNQTRNLLIQHLASGREGKLAHLRSCAGQLDQFQARPRAVVIFTPEEEGAMPETAALPELRQRIERDIENIESWTPPPLLKSHQDMRYATAEIRAGRLPVGLALAAVVAAMILWSSASLRNLPALGASPGCFKSSRVWLCWLAPVANLYLPCAVTRNIWYGSDPGGLTHPDGLRLPMVGLWWLTFIGAIGVFGYAVYLMATAVGVFMIGEAARWVFYANVTALAMAVSTFLLVAAATWNQSRRVAMVEATEAQLGPVRAWQGK